MGEEEKTSSERREARMYDAQSRKYRGGGSTVTFGFLLLLSILSRLRCPTLPFQLALPVLFPMLSSQLAASFSKCPLLYIAISTFFVHPYEVRVFVSSRYVSIHEGAQEIIILPLRAL